MMARRITSALFAVAILFSLATSPLLAQGKGDRPKAQDVEEKKRSEEAGATIAGIGVALFVVYVALSLTVGLAPTWIALVRGHPNTAAIFIVNFFLSWTCIGWIVALAWAFTAIDRPMTRYARRRDRGDDNPFE